MKTILLVDDDRALLKVMQTWFEKPGSGFRVLTGTNGQEAVQLLEQHAVDVVVTDLVMPVMDGFKLLAYLAGHAIPVPVVVISAHATEAEFKPFRGNFSGYVFFLPKPFTPQALADAVDHALGNTVAGMLKGITLTSLLQILALEKKSCTLRLTNQGRLGLMHLREGTLAQAVVDDLVGLEAAYHLLSWKAPFIEIDASLAELAISLAENIDSLVMEATFREDSGQIAETGHEALPGPHLGLKAFLEEALGIDGVLAVSLLDGHQGALLDSLGSPLFEREVLMATMLAQLTESGGRPGPDEISMVLDGQLHLFLPLLQNPKCYLHACMDNRRNMRSVVYHRLRTLVAQEVDTQECPS